MELLERENYLEELNNTFNNLSGGNGCVVIISGEAGIGKTSLVEHFTKNIDGNANTFWGACDDLFTPRPLGPLYDIALQLKNGLLKLLDEKADRTKIFTRFLQDLQQSEFPNLLIIEDVHWADESTLDLIKFLGRRSNKINSLLIITYRDDEIGSKHPLRLVLGDLPARNLYKYKLQSLTEKTVNELANTYGIKNLFKITSGNPFLITELLSNKNKGVPSSIKDSILTRISRLSAEAFNLIECVSIIPTRAERWLINEIVPTYPEIFEECLTSGILLIDDGVVSFRHELSRISVEESLTESKRQMFNEKVLKVLLKQKKTDDYLPRIIHHALKVPDKEILIKYSPLAAKQASDLSAHKLAAEHYGNALKFAGDLSIKEQLDLYEGRAYECYLTGQIEEGIQACEAIIELLKKYSDPYREGKNYRRLSRLLWQSGQDFKSEEYIFKAIEILKKLKPGKQLGMAYSNLSAIYMCRENTEGTVKWGMKAIELAKKVNDLETEVNTHITIGSRKMCDNDDEGEYELKESLKVSLKNDFSELAARAYNNIGSTFLWRRNLPQAEKYFSLGFDYCIEKDIDSMGTFITGDYARTKLFMGKWDEAIEIANTVLKRDNVSFMQRIVPLYVIGIIRTRRNDPGAISIFNELNSKIGSVGEIWEMIVTVKVAAAETCWLQNKLENAIDEIEIVYNKLMAKGNLWLIGELAFWLWKANRLTEIPGRIAKPYLLMIKGEWNSAAGLWEELGCPYEQALALSEGDEDAMKCAIEIFDSLGASATSQLIKMKMREMGIKRIPKGPRRTTRKNPAGLTLRQIEVLKLLGKGLSNNEISTKLYISPKTVDHHVSAILSKLNIHSRFEAASFVNSDGITIN